MDNFYEITESPDLKLVDTVSELRHYLNVWGYSDAIIKHFKTDHETLEKVCDYGYGRLLVKNAIADIDEIIADREEQDARREKAELKNYELLRSLVDMQSTFCNGCGIRKIKTRLTKLAKTGNPLAKCQRLLLETETVNIKAKEDGINYYPGFRFQHTVKEMLYYQKEQLIDEIIDLCKTNGYEYGYQDTDNYSANYLVYFEIPNTKQISFHTNLDTLATSGCPLYEKEWDGLENSTLPKLEESIMLNFPDITK